MIERSGFGDAIAAFDAAAGSGNLFQMQQAIAEDFLRSLAAIGSPDDVVAGLRTYLDAGASSPCVGAIARTDVEGTLRAAAALL